MEKKAGPKAVPPVVQVVYDASGNVVNQRAQFEARGYVVGSTVASLCGVVGFDNGKEKNVDKNTLARGWNCFSNKRMT